MTSAPRTSWWCRGPRTAGKPEDVPLGRLTLQVIRRELRSLTARGVPNAPSDDALIAEATKAVVSILR